MIALVRVDNRLLHGQIFEAWVPRLRVGQVLVADDAAAASPLARAAMKLATPPELSAEIRPVAEVDWTAVSRAFEPILVVFREISDLQRAVERGLTPQQAPVVNLGNVHFAPGRRAITPSVFLSQQEMEAVLELARLGFSVEARSVPAESPTDVETMSERYCQAS